MAAGYNLKQIQECLGHGDLATTGRYIKNLPVPRGTTYRRFGSNTAMPEEGLEPPTRGL